MFVLVLLIDFTGAFKTINHSRLMKRLSGIAGGAFGFTGNYLKGCGQMVSIGSQYG